MAIKFTELFKQGSPDGQTLFEFPADVSLGFEDPDAEPFYIKTKLAVPTDEPATRVYSQDEVSIPGNAQFADGTPVRDAPEDGPGALERMGTGAALQPDPLTVELEADNG